MGLPSNALSTGEKSSDGARTGAVGTTIGNGSPWIGGARTLLSRRCVAVSSSWRADRELNWGRCRTGQEGLVLVQGLVEGGTSVVPQRESCQVINRPALDR
jgi:hypothetical protein